MPIDNFDLARLGTQHPNPLYNYLTNFLPRTLKKVFELCEYVYVNSPQIFAALNKLATYPITSVVYNTDNAKLKDKHQNLLEKKLHIRAQLGRAGINKFLYGNSFVSMYFPFKRFLQCNSCNAKVNVKNAKFTFKIHKKNPEFKMDCPVCKKHGARATVVDERVEYIGGISVIHWNPKHIDIESNAITGEKEYYYEIPASIRKKVRRGDKHTLMTMPMPFITAVAKGEIFKFAPGKIYHMSSDSPAGMDEAWGLPMLAGNLGRFMYVATLRKANEAIALEYIVPFRVMHPAQSSATGDPTRMISLANWVDQTKMNYKSWRRDPLHLMFAPIPVGITNVGGNGRALMVTGEINEAETSMIVSMGVPKEFIYGGLSATGSGVTLRMLENQLRNHTNELDELAQWIDDRCAEFLGWKKISVELEPFKLVDDVQQKQLMLNANEATGGQLLSTTSLASLLGRDLRKERELRMQEMLDEEKFRYDLDSKMKELHDNLAERAQTASMAGNAVGRIISRKSSHRPTRSFSSLCRWMMAAARASCTPCRSRTT